LSETAQASVISANLQVDSYSQFLRIRI
jgi:hypothetical protein